MANRLNDVVGVIVNEEKATVKYCQEAPSNASPNIEGYHVSTCHSDGHGDMYPPNRLLEKSMVAC